MFNNNLDKENNYQEVLALWLPAWMVTSDHQLHIKFNQTHIEKLDQIRKRYIERQYVNTHWQVRKTCF